MDIRKIAGIALLPLFFASFICSQSLAELSKKEKERRDALKGKKGVVITNYDLKRLRKRPAVIVLGSQSEDEAGDSSTTPEGTSAPRPAVISVPTSAPAAATSMSQKTPEEIRMELEQKYVSAKEYADLLEMKMNGLWQEYYSMDDMAPRDKIQKEISETSIKLEEAREREAKAKEELDRFLATGKR
jgi:hypothetical protein